ncbi:MAG: flagellar basal body rod protein FlgC [Nitrospirae bacterium]|nr:flagellar basal body rod protein FlgC [Nitrospirota bacterium]MCL5237170.1 flagellar basal body rod protein FlgC [Nitrospirota bacterium]
MKDMFMPLKVSATALEAQKIRMNTIASNIANVNSTKTPGGGPYRRKDVVFESFLFDESSIGVDIPKIVEDQRAFKTVYEPGHPDADKDGYVSYPNINTIEEMVNLMAAARAYEANLTLMGSYKDMFMKTLDLMKT